jgi:uncharacterized protein
MNLHPKIRELQLRAKPVNNSYTESDNELMIEDRRVKGYLAVFGTPDCYGTVFMKGCFTRSIQERGPKSSAKYKITFLNQHDQSDPLCVFDVLEEDDYGLYFEANIDEVECLDRILTQIRSGTLNQFSIGFNYIWEAVSVDEKTGILLLHEVELYEGSVVTIGANKDTYAIRGMEDSKEDLLKDTESFIKSIDRKKQLELRQLISRHISQSQVEPIEHRNTSLELRKPIEADVDYEYLLTNLKLF